MKTTEKEMDMLNGGIAGKLILFSLPLAFSSILQQLFNSADVAVVGRFAGDQALAAVGSCVALVGIFVNLIVGLSVGPNAVLASLIGQKKRERIPGMLHTVLTFGAALGVFLMLLGMLTARLVLEASGTPESVMSEASLTSVSKISADLTSALTSAYPTGKTSEAHITSDIMTAINLFFIICSFLI